MFRDKTGMRAYLPHFFPFFSSFFSFFSLMKGPQIILTYSNYLN